MVDSFEFCSIYISLNIALENYAIAGKFTTLCESL